jgi:hypothetical protein
LETPYSRGQFRWRFADESNPRELALKQETIARIDTFWNLFGQRCESWRTDFGNSGSKSMVHFLQPAIATIEDGIMWECGPGDDSNFALDLTAETNYFLRPIIQTVLERAPQIPGWVFSEYKKPLRPASLAVDGFVCRRQKSLYPFSATFEKSEASGINVIVSSPKFEKENEIEDLNDAFLLAEVALGEENLDHWIDYIFTKGCKLDECSSEAQAVEAMVNGFEKLKGDLIDGLPGVPYHKFPQREQYYNVELNSENMQTLPRYGLTLWLIEFMNVFTKGLRFNSRRLSRFGERFCYLRFEGATGMDPVSRGEIEDSLDAQLREAAVGCVFGGGSGPNSSMFIDLCLEDIEVAIPLLRSSVEMAKLPHNAKLRFYDADLVHEWVGMFNDTAGPRDATRVWQG